MKICGQTNLTVVFHVVIMVLHIIDHNRKSEAMQVYAY